MSLATFGDRIRAAREHLDLTQDALRIAAGLSKGFLSELENGKRNPSANTVCVLADELKVSVEWLIRGKNQTVQCPLCGGRGKLKF
jgi:transcriptional regulator with XRE-family HTH domain